MKEVIRLDQIGQEKEVKALKPIELTHILDGDEGWSYDIAVLALKADEILSYIGKCEEDGDMFMSKDEGGYIRIYKGHLNDGIY